MPSLNFDENPLESFKEIKDLAPSVYRKLLDNDEIFNLVLILFPEQKVLKMLVEHFRQQNLPSLNFDENPLESFREIKDLAPSVYRKLLDNDGIFNLVLILFPEQKVLKILMEYFRQQNKTIYQQLASKLEEKLLSLR